MRRALTPCLLVALLVPVLAGCGGSRASAEESDAVDDDDCVEPAAEIEEAA